MLPGVDADAAFEATEQAPRELGEGLDDAGFPLRLSAGLSTYPYDGAGATQLLRAADQALYRAKASGKNQRRRFREIVARRRRRRTILPARGDAAARRDGGPLGARRRDGRRGRDLGRGIGRRGARAPRARRSHSSSAQRRR